MYQVMGKQTATQGWQNLSCNGNEGMAIAMADQLKGQGIYEYVKVVDGQGMLVYQA